jgi:hypothetical protein
MSETFELCSDYEPEHARDSVPWTRRGHPALEPLDRGKAVTKWDYWVVNYGADKHRVYSNRKLIEVGAEHGGVPRGPAEERAFAELWDYYNNSGSTRILPALLPRELTRYSHESKLMEFAVATVVQWLGTNVGACFVDEARANAKRLIFDLWPEVIRQMRLQCVIGMSTHTQLRYTEEKYKEAKRAGRQNFAGKDG